MDQLFYRELLQKNPDLCVLLDEPMKKHTTFRIGGAADYYAEPEEAQLSGVFAVAKKYGVPVTVIGNGSNLLVRDNGIRGLVVSVAKPMSAITVDGERMRVQAGALLAKAAHTAAEHGLSGMEFAAGIPGSVGGAVVMNAGAYGGEMKDILTFATVLTKDGSVLTLPAEELDLGYRYSSIPQKGYTVTGAEFLLKRKAPEDIFKRMEELKAKRCEKQPLEFPSAGSTFKRPEGYFAGKLIMDAGLCGYRVNDAQVSEKHCGFVINRGNATAADVLRLIADVKEKVFEKFQVELEPEIRTIGE